MEGGRARFVDPSVADDWAVEEQLRAKQGSAAKFKSFRLPVASMRVHPRPSGAARPSTAARACGWLAAAPVAAAPVICTTHPEAPPFGLHGKGEWGGGGHVAAWWRAPMP